MAPETVRDPRALAGRPVRDAVGRHVGRVQDVFLADRDGALAAISVEVGRLGSHRVLVPAALLEMGEGGQLRVRAAAERVRSGPEAPATGHVREQELRAAVRALGGEPGESARGAGSASDGPDPGGDRDRHPRGA